MSSLPSKKSPMESSTEADGGSFFTSGSHIEIYSILSLCGVEEGISDIELSHEGVYFEEEIFVDVFVLWVEHASLFVDDPEDGAATNIVLEFHGGGEFGFELVCPTYVSHE